MNDKNLLTVQDYLNTASLMQKEEKLDQAIASYREAIALQPIQPGKIYQELAGVLAKQDQVLEAITVYREFLSSDELNKTNRSSKKLYLCLGEVIIQLGVKHDYLDELASFFQETCELYPNHPTHFYNLAIVLTRNSQFDQAISKFEKVISIDHSFYQAYLELGRIIERKEKDENKAFKYYLKALKVHPRSGEINNLCVGTIDKMSAWMSSKRLEKKMQAYQSVIESVDSTQVNLCRTYLSFGRLLASLGNVEEAIQYNRKASHYKVQRDYSDLASQNQILEQFQLKEPSFIVIGVMKCGTTSLYDYVTKHPKIIQSLVKELHFFDQFVNNLKKDNSDQLKFDLSDMDKQLYLSYFLPVSQEQGFMTGEATPSYLTTPGVEKLVFNSFPSTKLIAILRDPVKRAISQYNMGLRGGKQNFPLETVVERDMKTYEEIHDFSNVGEKRPQGLLLKGLYVYFLEKWMQLFPREQLLILRTEDLSEDPAAVMKQVFEFLGVPDYQHIQFPRKNKGTYSSKIDEGLLSELYEFYRPHNQRLEELLGRKFNWDLKL